MACAEGFLDGRTKVPRVAFLDEQRTAVLTDICMLPGGIFPNNLVNHVNPVQVVTPFIPVMYSYIPFIDTLVLHASSWPYAFLLRRVVHAIDAF